MRLCSAYGNARLYGGGSVAFVGNVDVALFYALFIAAAEVVNFVYESYGNGYIVLGKRFLRQRRWLG